MNAATETLPARPARTTPHATHKFLWLLKREFWEHRGGLLWAPLVASALFLFFSLLGGGLGQLAFNREMASQGGLVTVNGRSVRLADVNWDTIFADASAQDLVQMSDVLNGSLLMPAFWPLTVLGFVVFFYLLGALFDERKDRSVLFWKSLPVSDTQTVLSKLATALVVAPLVAVAIAAVTVLLFTLIAAVWLGLNHAPVGRLLGMIDPLSIGGGLLAWIPMYILWALPTAGWLLLCSAWARSKPFLWAIGVPVLAGILVSWFGLLDGTMRNGDGWFWENVVLRMLGGVFPGIHVIGMARELGGERLNGVGNLRELAMAASGYSLLSSPALWIGVIAGIVMIVAAIRLRRWRDDA